jgi:hypothetical protein
VVTWPVCRIVVVNMHSAGKHNRQNHDTPAHRPRNHTLYDIPPNLFVFEVTPEGSKKLPDDSKLLPKHIGVSI